MLSIQIPSVTGDHESRSIAKSRKRPVRKECPEWAAVAYDLWQEKKQASRIYDDVYRRLKRLRRCIDRVKEKTYAAEVQLILYGICVLEKMEVGMIHVRLMMILSQVEEMYTSHVEEMYIEKTEEM